MSEQLFGVIQLDPQQEGFRWCSLGGMSKEEAERIAAEPNRVSGADGHEVITVGIAPFDPSNPSSQLPVLFPRVAAVDVANALAWAKEQGWGPRVKGRLAHKRLISSIAADVQSLADEARELSSAIVELGSWLTHETTAALVSCQPERLEALKQTTAKLTECLEKYRSES